MNIQGKPFAPKPVRKTSNFSGFKAENSFDRDRLSLPSGYVSNSARSKKVFDWSKELLTDIPKLDFLQQTNFTQIHLVELEFEADLENCYLNESAKSEILSILQKNDSTFYKSSNCDTIDCPQEDQTRTSVPPIRSSNPFHKNFTNENSDELNLVRFNSGKITSTTCNKLLMN